MSHRSPGGSGGHAGSAVLYVGRLGRPASDPLDGVTVLDDTEVAPHELREALAGAALLALLDPLSFPLEQLDRRAWSLPLVVALPTTTPSLTTDVLGAPLLDHLGPHDRILGCDDALWETLREIYGWVDRQRLGGALEEDELVEAALQLFSGPDRVGRHAAKQARGAYGRPLLRQLRAARDQQPRTRSFTAAVLGVEAVQWTSELLREAAEVVAFVPGDADRQALGHPRLQMEAVPDSLRLPCAPDAFDVVVVAGPLEQPMLHQQRRLLGEALRCLRPGGRMILPQRFLVLDDEGAPTKGSVRLDDWLHLVLDGTDRQVVLEDVECVRPPGADHHEGAVVSLTAISEPRAW